MFMNILYKYTSVQGAISILESNSIGFSLAKDLNDPFEICGASVDTRAETRSNTEAKCLLSEYAGILSLTRNHLNPIMWSMYAESHKGVVIGFDVDKAGLNKDCIIAAHEGDIIYSRTHPGKIFSSDSVGVIKNTLFLDELETPRHNKDDERAIMRSFFLHKSNEWVHEEEVRVVKSLKLNKLPNNDEWNRVKLNDRTLHCLKLPLHSIDHVYVGARFFDVPYENRHYPHSVLDYFIQLGHSVSTVKTIEGSWLMAVDKLRGRDGIHVI